MWSFHAVSEHAVVLHCICQEAQAELEAESAKGKLHPIRCDLTKQDEIAAMFEEIKKEYGVVHVCINNAGVVFDASLVSGNRDEWRNMMDVSKLLFK